MLKVSKLLDYGLTSSLVVVTIAHRMILIHIVLQKLLNLRDLNIPTVRKLLNDLLSKTSIYDIVNNKDKS